MKTGAPAAATRSNALATGMHATRLGILLFALAAIAGPLYTVPEYSPVSNLISELGAQGTPRSWIMSAGFLALGAGIVAGGCVGFSCPLLPFMAFGVFMALAGLLGHKPVDPDVPYVSWVHAAHSALATAAGVSITAGLAWQAV